jgi:hypothetical protein
MISWTANLEVEVELELELEHRRAQESTIRRRRRGRGRDRDRNKDRQTQRALGAVRGAGCWCRLGDRLAALLMQASIFFRSGPVVDHRCKICLISGACASNLPEPEPEPRKLPTSL